MKNLAFTTLIKSKGYSRETLADALHLSGASVSRKAGGKIPWTWTEVSQVCAMLDITYDDFAAYFPAGGKVKPSNHAPKTKNECICDALEASCKALEALKTVLTA